MEAAPQSSRGLTSSWEDYVSGGRWQHRGRDSDGKWPSHPVYHMQGLYRARYDIYIYIYIRKLTRSVE